MHDDGTLLELKCTTDGVLVTNRGFDNTAYVVN